MRSMVLGTINSTRRDLTKPVVASLIIDANAQDLPQEGPGTGVPNLNYLVAVHAERIRP